MKEDAMVAIHDRAVTMVHTVPLGWHAAAAALTATKVNPKAGRPPGDEAGGEGLGELIRVFGVDDGLEWMPRPEGKIVEVTGPLHALVTLALRLRVWGRRELIGDDPTVVRIRNEVAAFKEAVAGLFAAAALRDAERLARNGFGRGK